MQDNALLIQFAQNNSDAAFSQLVARHLPLVYRTCRRELLSDTLAEDAAQVAFPLLARKVGTLNKLSASGTMGAWVLGLRIHGLQSMRLRLARPAMRRWFARAMCRS